MSNQGTAFLNKGKQNFFKRLSDAELHPIEVPEWEAIIYRPASVSVQRMSRIKVAMESGGLEHLAQIIIDIARDEEGKPVFKQSHKQSFLTEQDPNVVIRVANELSEALVADNVDDVAENLGKTNLETSSQLPSS